MFLLLEFLLKRPRDSLHLERGTMNLCFHSTHVAYMIAERRATILLLSQIFNDIYCGMYFRNGDFLENHATGTAMLIDVLHFKLNP